MGTILLDREVITEKFIKETIKGIETSISKGQQTFSLKFQGVKKFEPSFLGWLLLLQEKNKEKKLKFKLEFNLEAEDQLILGFQTAQLLLNYIDNSRLNIDISPALPHTLPDMLSYRKNLYPLY